MNWAGAADARASRSSLPQLDGEPRLEAVIFDAGLTLISAATPAAAVAAETLEAHGITASPAETAKAMDEAEREIRSRWLHRDWWASEQTVRELFVGGYQAGLRSVAAVGEDSALANRLAYAVYENYQGTRHWQLFPDVLLTMEALRAAGVTMGIVSDWGRGLEAIVLELELGHFLSFVVISAHIGLSKPDPRVFQMALDRIAAPAHSAVYVGDTYVKDVLGARAAGLAPILLDRQDDAPPLDCPTVRELTDLLPLLGLPRLGPDRRPSHRAAEVSF